MGVLSELEPKDVFRFFEEISMIPRGSGNMAGISEYVRKECEKAVAFVRTDDALNVIAVMPATEGYENASPVMLQGHMDMVAEKTPDSTHDFKMDPLTLRIDGDWIRADRTTLGADDGVAVAYMLALLNDRTTGHPRLECIFTTDEETGMDGAEAIDLSDLQAKLLLNMDNEAEGIFTVSCAGGSRFEGVLPVKRTLQRGVVTRITVESKKGGHSGTEIKYDRPNTNVVAGELIADLKEKDASFSLVSIDGGLMDNAITTKTEIVAVTDAILSLAEEEARFQSEFESTDDTVTIRAEVLSDQGEEAVMTKETLDDLLFMFLVSPNGAITYNHKIKGLVETSLNRGILITERDRFVFRTSVRSSVTTRKERLLDRLKLIVERAGGTSRVEGNYPGWAYKEKSEFRDKAVSLWNRMYPEKPAGIEAIHAGLECGLLLEKKPDLDILSIGPDAWYIHTPKEQVSVSSVARVYEFIKKLLEETNS